MAEEAGRRRRAAVVVLGDIGRSPRMQYHSLSLANQAGMEVDIVANGGSDPHLSLRENPSIHIHEMKSVQLSGISKISGALALLLKAAIQFILLIWFLCFKIPRPDVFVVQNPPSVPTLAAVKLVSWLRGAKFIVDWHNFGYTLLGLSHGRSHVIVKVYFWFEKHFGRMADGAFCVTKAMQHELAQNWGIKATVLYDHSPEFFHPASLTEKHELFCRLGRSICSAMGSADCFSVEKEVEDENTTALTSKIDGGVLLKPNRPALVVSSTSWTPDEDFSILLEAALMYDRRVAATLGEEDSMDEGQLWIDIKNGKQFDYPRLLFIITGKGPDRNKYEEQIKRLKLRRVAFRTMWLASEDYPLLLGSADLGVSLHTSSSGLDLPMKVVDMFGCGLPVCAASFSCIEELVKVNKNGLLFSTSSELADELMMLFKGFPEECDTLKSLKDGALSTGSSSKWSNEWETNALPLVNQVIG
ncbi:UDP-glycosyltransferase TURAN-like [Triticum dicoccoides]|uniref:UDP-glycosyltransferase TURAN-like n=1 Tax=Triticum dicoccoides TaxID=85692 RepID=UPI000E78F6DB|nr:UDP-glycosyltransferase TURAN-like [Triticum dicoccoides]